MPIGPNSEIHCYQGSITYFYMKKRESLCKMDFSLLPELDDNKCECKLRDFEWYF